MSSSKAASEYSQTVLSFEVPFTILQLREGCYHGSNLSIHQGKITIDQSTSTCSPALQYRAQTLQAYLIPELRYCYQNFSIFALIASLSYSYQFQT